MDDNKKLYAQWDCPYCGRNGLTGAQNICSACQTARPADITFYLPKEAQGGWVCPVCLCVNKNGKDKCISCHTVHSPQNKENFQQKVQYNYDSKPPVKKSEKKEVLGCSAIFWGFGLAFALILVIIFYPSIKHTATSIFNSIDSLFSKQMTAMVLDIKWERRASLFEKKEVIEEGWELPPTGTLLESFQAIHHKEKRHKGYREGQRIVKVKLPNGKYQERTETYKEDIFEEEPVYKLKYKYRIPRWVKIKPLKSSGYNRTPYWPTDSRSSDKEHYSILEKHEKYFLILKLPNNTTSEVEVPKSIWLTYSEGMKVDVIKHGISGKYTINTKKTT